MLRFALLLAIVASPLTSSHLFAQIPKKETLEGWVSSYRQHFNSDTLLATQYLDSIKTELLLKTDTALYWTARYNSERAFLWAIKKLDYQGTVQILKESLSIYESIDKKAEAAAVESRMGAAYLGLSAYDSALLYISSSLEKNQTLGNERRANRSLGDMFIAYFYKAEYEQAMNYIRMHVQKSLELGDTLILPQAYTNLAATFYRLQEYDSSKRYHFESLKWAEFKGQTMDIAYSYLNLGEIYSNEDLLDSAVYYLERSQGLFAEMNYKTGLNSNSLNLAKVFLKKQNYREALSNVANSIEMSEEASNMALLRDALDIKLSIEKERGNYQGALNTLERINLIQDSLDLKLNKASMDELITRYETRELQQKIEVQDAKLSEQRAMIQRNQVAAIAAVVATILLVFISLLWRNRVRKKQQLQLQEERLARQEAEINAAISSQEKERARYARDLHDGFGQMISVLNLNIKSLMENSTVEDRQKVFDNSSQVIDKMYEELKGICFDLMPQTLVRNGLQSGLQEFASRINTAGKIQVITSFFGLEKRLLEVQEISLYRICQEWINNVVKYSNASEITLQITIDDSEITLVIEDNGSGFDSVRLTNSEGNGWKNIQSRSNLIKGRLELDTSPNRSGNTLVINAPLRLGLITETRKKITTTSEQQDRI